MFFIDSGAVLILTLTILVFLLFHISTFYWLFERGNPGITSRRICNNKRKFWVMIFWSSGIWGMFIYSTSLSQDWNLWSSFLDRILLYILKFKVVSRRFTNPMVLAWWLNEGGTYFLISTFPMVRCLISSCVEVGCMWWGLWGGGLCGEVGCHSQWFRTGNCGGVFCNRIVFSWISILLIFLPEHLTGWFYLKMLSVTMEVP